MTQIEPTPDTIGKRIAYFRKKLDAGSARELSERINHPSITPAIIQNIESGRKADLSISQLMNIAIGIGISPMFLLAQIDQPNNLLDIPNLNATLASATVREFDVWMSASGNETMAGISGVRGLLHQMARRDIRSLALQIEYWQDDEEGMQFLTADEVQNHREQGQRIQRLYRSLSELFDVSWAAGPWLRGGL